MEEAESEPQSLASSLHRLPCTVDYSGEVRGAAAYTEWRAGPVFREDGGQHTDNLPSGGQLLGEQAQMIFRGRALHGRRLLFGDGDDEPSRREPGEVTAQRIVGVWRRREHRGPIPLDAVVGAADSSRYSWQAFARPGAWYTYEHGQLPTERDALPMALRHVQVLDQLATPVPLDDVQAVCDELADDQVAP
ncbi:hypothetical protein CDCA_CDCA08G2460 [Cyanidium caldarium]|uniref:Uncharacterized protein n=1 Tax=Cyanidium caldarium TaxID=2771 RepID=A0AAV9IVU2_CYACA|nr:hypothetical protein CDCA_CDCA08G2460 [Cyanidium caldarium]